VKKGENSVGVISHYCGRTGKIDNCQVGVFAALVAGDKSLPIDFRLYLPKEWADDVPWCLKAGLPQNKIQFKTKCQQAIEMVKATAANGVRFNWVGADGGYPNPNTVNPTSCLSGEAGVIARCAVEVADRGSWKKSECPPATGRIRVATSRHRADGQTSSRWFVTR
jgi:SRSO17 transposase